jgi:hypothetical protein
MASDLIELNDVSFKEDKLNLLYLAVEIDNPYENTNALQLSAMCTTFCLILRQLLL